MASQNVGNTSLEPKEGKAKKSLQERYEQVWNMRAGVWIIAIVVLGLSAGIIAKKPRGPLLGAAAYNLAVAVAQFFLVCGPSPKPISPTNARPPTPFFVILGFTSVMWPPAFGVMFAMMSTDDAYEVVDLGKRAGIIISTGTGLVNMLENITIACGCMGVSAFVLCLFQWYYVWRILKGEFSDQEILEAYQKKDKPQAS